MSVKASNMNYHRNGVLNKFLKVNEISYLPSYLVILALVFSNSFLMKDQKTQKVRHFEQALPGPLLYPQEIFFCFTPFSLV